MKTKPRTAVREFFVRKRKHPPSEEQVALANLDLAFADSLFLAGIDPDRAHDLCGIYDAALLILHDAEISGSY
jgi:hypothetical protein